MEHVIKQLPSQLQKLAEKALCRYGLDDWPDIKVRCDDSTIGKSWTFFTPVEYVPTVTVYENGSVSAGCSTPVDPPTKKKPSRWKRGKMLRRALTQGFINATGRKPTKEDGYFIAQLANLRLKIDERTGHSQPPITTWKKNTTRI